MLEHHQRYQQLYALLRVPALSEADLMARVLLPHFSQLVDTVQQQLLKRVLMQWATWKADAALVAALSDTPFVLTGDNSCPPNLVLFSDMRASHAQKYKALPGSCWTFVNLMLDTLCVRLLQLMDRKGTPGNSTIQEMRCWPASLETRLYSLWNPLHSQAGCR